jgi:hypothetical protein
MISFRIPAVVISNPGTEFNLVKLGGNWRDSPGIFLSRLLARSNYAIRIGEHDYANLLTR